MKAILVFDNPNNCYECPCYKKGQTRYECSAYLFTNNRILIIDDLSNKPNDCPLKLLPQKRVLEDFVQNDYFMGSKVDLEKMIRYVRARANNEIIDEILGEEDDR